MEAGDVWGVEFAQDRMTGVKGGAMVGDNEKNRYTCLNRLVSVQKLVELY